MMGWDDFPSMFTVADIHTRKMISICSVNCLGSCVQQLSNLLHWHFKYEKSRTEESKFHVLRWSESFKQVTGSRQAEEGPQLASLALSFHIFLSHLTSFICAVKISIARSGMLARHRGLTLQRSRLSNVSIILKKDSVGGNYVKCSVIVCMPLASQSIAPTTMQFKTGSKQ